MLSTRFRSQARIARIVAGAVALTGGSALAQDGNFSLRILHNNDGESALLPSGDNGEEGGIARFVDLVQQNRSENSILLSSGDNILPGQEWQAGRANDTYYDARALRRLNYDAVVLGNHDFDFGPNTLSDFIGAANDGGRTPFISSNLDFSSHAPLLDQLSSGNIAESRVVEVQGEGIGIVGATTPQLDSISSPGAVRVQDDVANQVQAEIDRFGRDVNKVVLVSHLQSVREDLDLIPQLSGVDIAIAGGGDELLANDQGQPGYSDDLLPSDAVDENSDGQPDPLQGPYPVTTEDFSPTSQGVDAVVNADGQTVPVVTTSGSYGYLGKLDTEFDADGNLLNVQQLDENNNVIRNFGPDGLSEDQTVLDEIQNPVQRYVDSLADQEIIRTEVRLNGVREDVRTRETNLGNLIADTLVWKAQQDPESFGVDIDDTVIGLHNGGGIRRSVVIDAGDAITQQDTFNILPFGNQVSIVEDFPVQRIDDLLENAVSRVENIDGRFAQVSNLNFTYDPDAPAGNRVLDILLQSEDGVEQIFADGEFVSDFTGRTVELATIDFLLGDADGYDFDGDGLIGGDDADTIDFTTLGATNREALVEYLNSSMFGDTILASQYPEGGEGRITAVSSSEPSVIPSPTALAGGLALLGATALRRRRRSRL